MLKRPFSFWRTRPKKTYVHSPLFWLHCSATGRFVTKDYITPKRCQNAVNALLEVDQDPGEGAISRSEYEYNPYPISE